MLKYAHCLIAVALISVATSAQAAAPDAALGQTTFKQKCSACHSDVKSKNGVGPSLFGVYGRAAATAPGYTYSKALKAAGLTWTADKLTAWLDKPTAVVPGTKMTFAPPLKPEEKANLIAYLKTKK